MCTSPVGAFVSIPGPLGVSLPLSCSCTPYNGYQGPLGVCSSVRWPLQGRRVAVQLQEVPVGAPVFLPGYGCVSDPWHWQDGMPGVQLEREGATDQRGRPPKAPKWP